MKIRHCGSAGLIKSLSSRQIDARFFLGRRGLRSVHRRVYIYPVWLTLTRRSWTVRSISRVTNVAKPTVPTLDFSAFSRMKRFPVTPLTLSRMKRFPVTPPDTGVSGVTGNLFMRLKTEKSSVGTVGFTTFITGDITHGVVMNLADQHDALPVFFRGAALRPQTCLHPLLKQETDVEGCLKTHC